MAGKRTAPDEGLGTLQRPLAELCCVNPECPDAGQRDHGNKHGSHRQGWRSLADPALLDVQDRVLRTQGDAYVGLDDGARQGRGHRESPQGGLRHSKDGSSRRRLW